MIATNYIVTPKSDQAFRFTRFIILVLVVLAVFFPILLISFYAFNLNSLAVGFSVKKLLSSFIWLIDHLDILTGLKNSLMRSVFTPIITCFVCFFAAYAIAMGKGKFFSVTYAYIVLSLYFIAGPLFSYLNMSSLSLTGSFWPYVLPYLFNSLYTIVLVASVKEVPREYAEEARVQGASELQIAWHVYLPVLSSRMVAVYVLCFIIHWNDYVDTLLYNFSSTDLYTLQYMSHSYTNNIISAISHHGSAISVSVTSVKMAMTVLLILPVVILIPMFRRGIVGFLKKT